MSIRDLNQYEIIKDEDLQDVKCHGYLLKHKKSGARLVLMEADDDNKVFSSRFPNTAGGQHRTSAYSGAFGTVWI